MSECFKCGVLGERTRLFDAVCGSGIVKVCFKCSSEENLPMIHKPTSFQINDSEKEKTFRQEVESFVEKPKPMRNDLSSKENVNLRDLVDRNLKVKGPEDAVPRPDLIHNFHWNIMRARRARHISREQFARDLGESEVVVKMIEQGVLPEDDNRIIRKVESYLGINLRNPGFRKQEKKEIGFDSVSVDNLTISDLKEMKENKGEVSEPVEVWEGEVGKEVDKDFVGAPQEDVHLGGASTSSRPSDIDVDASEGKKELSKEDMDDLIFDRKE